MKIIKRYEKTFRMLIMVIVIKLNKSIYIYIKKHIYKKRIISIIIYFLR